MQNQPPGEIANRGLSTTAAVMLLLACATGCGSVSSKTTGDGGPKDAKSSTGGSGGAGGASSSTGGSGGAGGAKASTGGSGGVGGAKSSTGGSGGGGGAKSSTGGSGGAGGVPGVGGVMAVNLRTAGNYVILAESAITTVPPSVITGNLG